MYLKEIKTFGFKSFADKINIEFSPNINGIVGPNGSGKSNIVDAIRWVLGEQSIKSLRGETNTDIIFSGSKSRKPLNSAMVALVFDNSDHHLPIDYNEVEIKRVSYRAGDNEFYINNERCRLKDIMNLLTDSGAAKESFNIISQGKIDEILSTKPADRRIIFEEAAGVLKYKKRKEEAIRKLERTNNNLTRINDIIGEVYSTLEPLQKQSEDAKTYNDSLNKLKNIEVSLTVSDIEKLNYDYRITKEKMDHLNDEIITLTSNNTSYDVELIKEKNQLKNIEETIVTKQNELVTVTKTIEQIDADIRLLKERKKYTNETNNIDENIISLKEESLNINNNIATLKNSIDINSKKINDNNDYLNNLMQKYNDIKDKRNTINNNLIKNKRKEADYQYKIDYLENTINNNQSLPSSVKSILNNNKFNGVHNIIGKLIDMKEEYATCISTALGASSSYLVVDSREDAKVLVNYLKENNIGRATFFPLDVIKPRTIDLETLSKLSTQTAFISTADKLTTYKPTYQNIILNQLGNVIITDNISNANYLSELVNHRYKVVTLDGQVVNVGGSITGGKEYKASNVIKEKYDLERLKHELNELITFDKEQEKDLSLLNLELNDYESRIYETRLHNNELKELIASKESEIEKNQTTYERITKEISDLENIVGNNTSSEETRMLENYHREIDHKETIIKELNILRLDKDKINNNIKEIEDTNKKSTSNINKLTSTLKEEEIKLNRIDVRLDNLLLTLTNNYNMTFDFAKETYRLEIDPEDARDIVKELKQKIEDLGNVNLGAIEEYERVSERYNFLTKQKEDLENAEDTLLEIIKEMDGIMEEKFLTTFEQIKLEFQNVFRELFKGGKAELILTEPDNVLETGIDIKAEPPGKKLQSISLLSGGEKTFTAISLLFAILNVRPVPFCVLDEVEAALDDANVDAFGNYLNRYQGKTQFILITHKKKTMEFANVLYGITMQESGVSKLVSVKLEEIKA